MKADQAQALCSTQVAPYLGRDTVRVCSFLPSATEIIFELGLGKALFGVSHECDYPPEARQKPTVVTSAVKTTDLASREVEDKILWHVREGKSLYLVDRKKLQEADPDIIITQELCTVCAPSTNEVAQAFSLLKKEPAVVSLNPSSLGDILSGIIKIGKVLDRAEKAKEVVKSLRERINHVSQTCKDPTRRPSVFCAEWLDPPYCGGHWVPEMVDIAGGHDGIGQRRQPSYRVELKEIMLYDPEILILMPCGYDAKKAAEDFRKVRELWNSLGPVREGRVYAVDANSYFSRPGPRVVTGLEILARIIQPDFFKKKAPPNSIIQLGGA